MVQYLKQFIFFHTGVKEYSLLIGCVVQERTLKKRINKENAPIYESMCVLKLCYMMNKTQTTH